LPKNNLFFLNKIVISGKSMHVRPESVTHLVVGEHAVVGKETLKFGSIFPHFALNSSEREVKSPCFYYAELSKIVGQNID
jgi:hypothetical protein